MHNGKRLTILVIYINTGIEDGINWARKFHTEWVEQSQRIAIIKRHIPFLDIYPNSKFLDGFYYCQWLFIWVLTNEIFSITMIDVAECIVKVTIAMLWILISSSWSIWQTNQPEEFLPDGHFPVMGAVGESLPGPDTVLRADVCFLFPLWGWFLTPVYLQPVCWHLQLRVCCFWV